MEHTQPKQIDLRLKQLSYSSRLLLDSCPRKYQLKKLGADISDATDAALAAADAADAATTKAQEAVDAVATLSAQVSKLITALKAQITTLTNLVIKIQKKVRA